MGDLGEGNDQPPRPRRRRYRIGAATVAGVLAATVAGALAAVSLSGRTTAQPAAPARSDWCVTDSRQMPDAGWLPAQVQVARVVTCRVGLVERPGQGWWLQLTEQDAVTGAGAYASAARLPSSPGPCPTMPMGSGTASSYGNEPPTLVVDAAGALHHLRLPVVGCGMQPGALAEAVSALQWLPPRVTWIRQLVPPSSDESACLPFWREELKSYWPYDWADLRRSSVVSGRTPMSSQELGRTHAWCSVLYAGPEGPIPRDLVVLRPVSDVSVATRVAAALDERPGISGPDPIGMAGAPGGTPPAPCRTPTTRPIEIVAGGQLLGYADRGLCLKAVGPDLGPPSSDLVTMVQEFTSDP